MRHLTLGISVVAALLAPALAVGQNLVTNPGFEGSTYFVSGVEVPTGWTYASNQIGPPFIVMSGMPALAHSGNTSLGIGAQGGTIWSLSQVLTTMPGSVYNFSFWTMSGMGPGTVTLTFGGVDLMADVSSNTPYTFYSATTTATSTSTPLSLTGYNEIGTTLVDDVSVTATPEPATLALVVSGLGIVGVVTLRRRRRA